MTEEPLGILLISWGTIVKSLDGKVPAPVCCCKNICNVYPFRQSCWEGCMPNWVSWEYTSVSTPAIFNMFLIIVCDSLLRGNRLVWPEKTDWMSHHLVVDTVVSFSHIPWGTQLHINACPSEKGTPYRKFPIVFLVRETRKLTWTAFQTLYLTSSAWSSDIWLAVTKAINRAKGDPCGCLESPPACVQPDL